MNLRNRLSRAASNIAGRANAYSQRAASRGQSVRSRVGANLYRAATAIANGLRR